MELIGVICVSLAVFYRWCEKRGYDVDTNKCRGYSPGVVYVPICPGELQRLDGYELHAVILDDAPVEFSPKEIERINQRTRPKPIVSR